jgi:nitrogen fixation protein FixH
MRVFGAILVSAAFVAPGPVYAQAHSHAAPNGGQIQNIGKYEAELVVKGSEVVLFVVDEKEQKVDSAKLSATAVVLAEGNQQKSVELAPAGDNKLTGKADFPVKGKFRATVTLKQGGAELGKGRYNVDVKS